MQTYASSFEKYTHLVKASVSEWIVITGIPPGGAVLNIQVIGEIFFSLIPLADTLFCQLYNT